MRTTATLAAAGIGLALAFTGCASTGTTGSAGPTGSAGTTGPAGAEVTGTEFDTMWLEMMIAHQEGAITMAQQVQGTTEDPDVRSLAGTVIAGQTAEIDTMRQLLTDRAG